MSGSGQVAGVGPRAVADEPGAAHDPAVGADPIQAPGTDERDWAAWPGLAKLAPCPLTRLRSVVVLAAHPDDEILGFGGALALLSAAGVRLRIGVATDGEASHPGSRTLSPARLAARRRQEDAASLARLGLGAARIDRFDLPDGGLTARQRDLDAAVGRLLAEADQTDVCVAPWQADVHPDHESVGRAALRVGAELGVPVWQYPVWTWHWARPGDPRVPWRRARRIDLPAWAVAAKREAVDCHLSQIKPLSSAAEDAAILPAGDLDHFRRDFEVVLV